MEKLKIVFGVLQLAFNEIKANPKLLLRFWPIPFLIFAVCVGGGTGAFIIISWTAILIIVDSVNGVYKRVWSYIMSAVGKE